MKPRRCSFNGVLIKWETRIDDLKYRSVLALFTNKHGKCFVLRKPLIIYFWKEAPCINLAGPSEIAVKACTPFFDYWKFVQFSVCEQKYLPLSNDVKKNLFTLFRQRHINIIYIQDIMEEKCVEIPMCKLFLVLNERYALILPKFNR